MLRLLTTPASVLPVFALSFVACGGAAIEWKSRPPQPQSRSWHCLATGQGSLCERSFDACRTSHRVVSQRTAAVHATTDDCRPAAEVWCFSYVLTPGKAPAAHELRSVREPGVDGWVYDCAATQRTCETNQARIVGDRTSSSEPTADVSPCERW